MLTIYEELGEYKRAPVLQKCDYAPAYSPWSRLIMVLPKSNGSLQLCNDFWHLNAVSEFDDYSLPRMDELVERLGKAHFIFTLYLTKGYSQASLTLHPTWRWPSVLPVPTASTRFLLLASKGHQQCCSSSWTSSSTPIACMPLPTPESVNWG